MDRRMFFKAIGLASGAALFAASNSHALQFYPHADKRKWAVLYGSRYGATRDAGIWISEGMGAIANVFDAREDPDLSQFDGVIVGSGIYSGKIDTRSRPTSQRTPPAFPPVSRHSISSVAEVRPPRWLRTMSLPSAKPAARSLR